MATYFSKYRITRVQMRRQALIAKILPILLVGSAVFAITTLFPAQTKVVTARRIFTEGLQVELDRTSPAFAAMEDTLLGDKLTEYESAVSPESQLPVAMLEAGQINMSGQLLADNLIRDNRREALLMAQARAQKELVERQIADAAAAAFERMAKKFGTGPQAAKILPTTLPGARANAWGHSAALAFGGPQAASIGQGGAAASVARASLASLRDSVAAPLGSLDNRSAPNLAQADSAPNPATSTETKTIRLADLGMTREQFMRELFMPLATADVSDAPAEIRVAGGRAVQSITPHTNFGSPRIGGVNPVEFRRIGNGGPHPSPGSVMVAPVGDLSGQTLSKSNRNGLLGEESTRASLPSERPQTHQAIPPTQMAANQVNQAASQQIVLGGHIEMAGGLALTNPTDTLAVYRSFDGEMAERGATWMHDGRYEILVEKPEGELIAELRTPQGELLGRGSFDLNHLPAAAQNKSKYTTLALQLTPVPQGISGRVTGVYAIAHPVQNVKEAKMAAARVLAEVQLDLEHLPLAAVSLKSGHFEEPNLVEGSTAFLRAQRAGYWPTHIFAAAGINNEVSMFKETMIDDLDVVLRTTRDARLGLISGRVTHGGAPVAGAQVELASNGEKLRPIYFDDNMQPDPVLEATTTNGLYAFYPLYAGVYAVRSAWGQSISDPVTLTVEGQVVSQADLEVGQTGSAKLRVFDAFQTNWPLAATVTKMGSDEPATEIPATGEGRIGFSGGATPLILDVEGGKNYEQVRFNLTRDHKSAYVPMLQTQWLEKIRNAQKINPQTHSGTIVGFIQGSSQFLVTVDEQSVSPNSRMLYFNARGEVTGKDYGEPGGGFIMFNVPEGYRTVLLQPKGLSKSFASTVLVESRVTNIVNHWMR